LHDSDYQGKPLSRGADIGFGVAFVALFASSAIYGYLTTGNCAEAKEQHERARQQYLSPPGPPPAAPPPGLPQPSPEPAAPQSSPAPAAAPPGSPPPVVSGSPAASGAPPGPVPAAAFPSTP